MAALVTPELLRNLAALYPTEAQSETQSRTATYLQNQWYLVAAVAFTSSNTPEAVPVVVQHALQDLKDLSATDDECLLLVRKTKDAIFKAGLLCGYPKSINALAALYEKLPERYRDAEPMRDITPSTDAFHAKGQATFDQMYGETSANVQSFLKNISADFEFFSTTFAYGFVYGAGILSPYETSFSIVAALICNDTPLQAGWHLNGALRNGATIEQVKAVRAISMTVAQAVGIVWKHPVPEVSHPK